MPFGVTLDFSTSTCWQFSGSFSVDWSSETHSIRMRISSQGTLLSICFQVDHVVNWNWSHRLIFFTTFVIYGFVPSIHWALLNGIGSDEVVLRFSNSLLLIFHIQTRLFLPRVLIMYLLAGLAFVFYIAKFPEVVLPGRYITPSFTRPKTSTESSWIVYHILLLAIKVWHPRKQSPVVAHFYLPLPCLL